MSKWKDAWNMLVRKLKIRRGASAGGFPTSYVPATAVLVLSAFAPSVQASAPQVVTPTTRAVTITRYPPTVTGPAPLVVTPTTRALTITERVPSVTASLHRLVVPGSRALLLTPNAPTVNGAVVVHPAFKPVVLARFTPTVTGTAHKIAVPTTRALTITERVPTVTSANHLVVTPTTKALATTRHVPTVTRTSHQRLTPAKKTVTITRNAPTITTSAGSGPSFYMAPGGSDAAAGTIGAPWATIQKFINTNPVAGSTLYLRDGDYNPATDGGHTGDGVGNLIGTASQPITIKNYPGEVPVFPNASGQSIIFRGNFTGSTVGANYVVLDGIRFTGCSPDDAATVVFGNAGSLAATAYLVKNITIRNCFFSLAAGLSNRDHPTGMVHGCENITFEDCEFQGPGPGGLGGDAIVAYSQPAARNILIQRCIFHDWYHKAIQFWDYNTSAPTATVQIKHCTFKNNYSDPGGDIDLRYHSTALIQDCVFDGPNTSNTIYDPFFSSATTRDHNYFSQTLTGSYGLTAGSPAINGAHDGTDAGAVPYP